MAKPKPVPRRALIFGAGVTGLSAAHELAQRGFRVMVVERDGDDRDPSKPAVGGMARSQYNRANPIAFRRYSRGKEDPKGMVDVQTLWVPDDRTARIEGTLLEFERSSLGFTAPTLAKPLPDLKDDLEEFLETYQYETNQEKKLRILVWARTEPGETLPGNASADDKAYETFHGESFALARARSKVIKKELEGSVQAANNTRAAQAKKVVVVDFVVLEPPLARRGDGPDSDFVGTRRGCGGIEFDDLLLPGEHGYRLFPSFYRNLLDVMKRTPLLEEAPSGSRSRVIARGSTDESPTSDKRSGEHTVFDMLRSIENHAFAPAPDKKGKGGPPPRLMIRSGPRSWEDALEAIRALYEDLEWLSSDVASYTTKVLQYLTSCKARRAEYSKNSWFDYLDAGNGSPGYQDSLKHWPKALVGLESQSADARSFGSVATQLMLDQVKPPGFRDGSLKGPTTEVWFDHWRTYLEDLGVVFVKGTLDAIRDSGLYTDPNPVATAATNVASIEFELTTSDPAWNAASGEFAIPVPNLPDTYLCNAFMVLALPLLESKDLAKGFVDDLAGAAALKWQPLLKNAVDPWHSTPNAVPKIKSDIQRLIDWKINDPRDGGSLKWDGTVHSSLRHFCGVQFYFRHDYALVPGHTYYPDSRWGLSSISQTQYRARRPGAREGYVGLMSVVLGDPNDEGKKKNNDHFFKLTREDAVKEVLKDLREGLVWGHMNLPDPVAYHLDTNMVYDDKTGLFKHNRTPYLTSLAGDWDGRPGRLDDPELWERAVAAASDDTHPGYDVYFGRLVFAGNHMKTFTRLGTMESANESGRHAVNGILSLYATAGMTVSHDDLGSGAFVRVYDLEDDEIDDFLFLKQLDCELLKLNLPHFLEILGVAQVGAALMPGGGGGDPIGQLLAMLTNSSQTAASATRIAQLIQVILGPSPPP